LEEKLPEAWNKILAEPDPLLIDLISKSTEKLCGITPEIEDVKRILKRVEKNAVLPAQSIEPINKEPKSQRDINAGEQGSSERYPKKEPGYVKSYRNQLKNPNSLTSKVKRFIDEKGSVSSNELKRVCVERFGCKSDMSGSIGAGIQALLRAGYITEDGRADNRRFFSKKR
jgi:dsDNA-specific endonuclease/ATPase MutS2